MLKLVKILNEIDSSNESKYVYHCARQEGDAYLKIFKYGFERYYLARGVGNLYGPGVYTTTDLESSIANAHRGEYGKVIIKGEIISYDNFLIWNKNLAIKVYGDNWKIENQLNVIFSPEIIDEIKEKSFYNNIIRYNDFSSDNAKTFYNHCKNANFTHGNPYHKINGFVFHGRRDGRVAVIKDVKNVIPLEYSFDYGQTWKVGQTEETLKHTKDEFDAAHKFGHLYAETQPVEFGWSKVKSKEGKINYIDKDGKPLSPVWFDGGGNFYSFGGKPFANIAYNDTSMFIDPKGLVYLDLDDNAICSVDEISDFF